MEGLLDVCGHGDVTYVLIDGFGSFLLYGAVCETFCGRAVDADWSWWCWLQVPKFLEGSAYRHGLLAIVKSGTNFGFSGGRHHVVEDLGDVMDMDIKRGIRERWLGRVSGFVAKEIVDTDAAVSTGFGKVGGITVEVQYHVTGVISDGGVWVGRRIIEEPNGCVTGCLCCFLCLGRDGSNGNEHGRVDRNDLV